MHFHNETLKAQKRETDKDTNQQKGFLYSWVRGINTVKIKMSPKYSYIFILTIIEIPVILFIKMERKVQKPIWILKDPKLPKQFPVKHQ